ncbi:MAG: hypothetical protein JWM98_1375, partial [Thermoleophilia bacterium]|nr:hypothetical protein [Thermoleophilia bacterium]
LVVDAQGAHNNASMQSYGNVLRVGTANGHAASSDPAVIMHELGHKFVDDFTLSQYGDTQGGAIHEGIADALAAAWTNDPVVGRVFTAGQPQPLRDLSTGRGLITTRQEWDRAAAVQAQNGAAGVEAHDASGVVSSVGARLVAQPGQMLRGPGDLSWSEVGDLYADAVRTGGMTRQMDFDSFSDSMRVAAARAYGTDSPQFARVNQALGQGGLLPQVQPGQGVSRITSAGRLEHGFTVEGYDPQGFVIVRDASGARSLQYPNQLLTGGGRWIPVDSAGAPQRVPQGNPYVVSRATGDSAAGATNSTSTTGSSYTVGPQYGATVAGAMDREERGNEQQATDAAALLERVQPAG